MLSTMLLLSLVVCLLHVSSSLKISPSLQQANSFKSWLVKSSSDMKVLLPATMLIPSVASATDGAQSAVLIPIAISILTMGPFLYYQQ